MKMTGGLGVYVRKCGCQTEGSSEKSGNIIKEAGTKKMLNGGQFLRLSLSFRLYSIFRPPSFLRCCSFLCYLDVLGHHNF